MRSTPMIEAARPVIAALAGAAVGILGGLIGLGGAEFRLPLLVRIFGYALRSAVFLNLAVSLVTVITALATRLVFGGAVPLTGGLDVVATMALGSVLGAYRGATWLAGVSEPGLRRAVKLLLLVIGMLLLVEAALIGERPAPEMAAVPRAAAALLAGFGIGVVSSLLGVAGGELIIPTLVFGFGVDVKVAGTLSLLVSVPTIIVGLWRHAWLGNAPRDRIDVTHIVVPMSAGSIAGAVGGGVLVSVVPGRGVRALLGAVLIASALRVFRSR